MNQNERPDTKALNEWLSAPGMGLMFSNEEAKNLVRPLVAWIDAQPSAPVAPEPDERLTAGRFTVSTDPDGRSYLFGKNDPEPYDGFISGGVELFAWEPEAVDALRVALAAAPELETLRDRIQQRERVALAAAPELETLRDRIQQRITPASPTAARSMRTANDR